jgi:hypothetical protein
MNIYLVARTDPPTYHEQLAVTIMAEDEDGARTIAAEHAGDECESIWYLPSTTVTFLGVADDAVVKNVDHLVCRDFWSS